MSISTAKADFKAKEFVGRSTNEKQLVAYIRKVAPPPNEKASKKRKMDELYDSKGEFEKDIVEGVLIDPMPIDTPKDELVQSIALDPSNRTVQFFPAFVHQENMNLRINVTGASGSGKSFFVGKIISLLQKRNKRKLVVISKVEQDMAYDGLKPTRIPMGDPDFTSLISDDFANHLVVFDDIDAYHDKGIVTFTQRLRDSILEAGRHKGIDIINVSHRIMGGDKTKKLIEESNYQVFFPHGQRAKMENYLMEYQGFRTKQLQELNKFAGDYAQGRYLLFHTHFPLYVMTEKTIKLMTSIFAPSEEDQ